MSCQVCVARRTGPSPQKPGLQVGASVPLGALGGKSDHLPDPGRDVAGHRQLRLIARSAAAVIFMVFCELRSGATAMHCMRRWGFSVVSAALFATALPATAAGVPELDGYLVSGFECCTAGTDSALRIAPTGA